MVHRKRGGFCDISFRFRKKLEKKKRRQEDKKMTDGDGNEERS